MSVFCLTFLPREKTERTMVVSLPVESQLAQLTGFPVVLLLSTEHKNKIRSFDHMISIPVEL